MKLSAEKLEAHLENKLAPVYLITGDEPLQREEAIAEDAAGCSVDCHKGGCGLGPTASPERGA